MTRLQWDQPGTRLYESGVDRGVLYLPEGGAVPWNGLTSVDESADANTEASYFDGVRYYDHAPIEDYRASVKAFTYPDELDRFVGMRELGAGYFADDQPLEPFTFSYRTRVGSDLDSELAYKIHIVFNVLATEDNSSYSSRSDQISPTDFGWTLNATPGAVEGFKPTAHIVVDSRTIDRFLLQEIEEMLYGTETTDPSIGTITEFTDWARNYEVFSIVDHGDGTWSVTGPAELITSTDDGFEIREIEGVDATPDADSYEITTTTA